MLNRAEIVTYFDICLFTPLLVKGGRMRPQNLLDFVVLFTTKTLDKRENQSQSYVFINVYKSYRQVLLFSEKNG